MVAMLACFGAEVATRTPLFIQIQQAPLAVLATFVTVIIGSVSPTILTDAFITTSTCFSNVHTKVWDALLGKYISTPNPICARVYFKTRISGVAHLPKLHDCSGLVCEMQFVNTSWGMCRQSQSWGEQTCSEKGSGKRLSSFKWAYLWYVLYLWLLLVSWW